MNYILTNDIEKYIDDIIKLDSQFYDEKYLWSSDYQRKVYQRNHDSFIAVTLDDKLIGYLNYLSITKEKFDSIINSNTTIDDFSLDEIVPFSNNTYIAVNSIVVLKEHQNKNVISLINNEFTNKIIDNDAVKGINGIAISDDGNKWFKNMGFKHLKKLDDNNDLFIYPKSNGVG